MHVVVGRWIRTRVCQRPFVQLLVEDVVNVPKLAFLEAVHTICAYRRIIDKIK
jgi:hypothetical protein